MKISLIKSKKDVQSFNLAKSFGMNVVELEENEEIESNKKGKKKSNWEKKYNVQRYISIGLAGVALVEFLII